MASKKNSSKKTQRAERNRKKATKPSPGARAHHHGAGAPQPRVITSQSRIEGIGRVLMRQMRNHLDRAGVEVPEGSGRESYIKCLCGLSDESFMISQYRKWISTDLGYGVLDAIDMAFARAYQETPDASLTPAGSFPGTNLVNFDNNIEILKIQANSRMRNFASLTSMKRPGYQIVGNKAVPRLSGAEVARRVHAASAKS